MIILLLVFLLLVIVCVLVIVASYSLQARRLHDIGFSGLWALGFLILGFIGGGTGYDLYDISIVTLIIGLIQLLYLLFLFFRPGTKGPNRFGQDPKWGDKEYAEAVFGESSQGQFYRQKQQTPATAYRQEPAAPAAKNYTSTAGRNSAPGLKGTKLSVTRRPKN